MIYKPRYVFLLKELFYSQLQIGVLLLLLLFFSCDKHKKNESTERILIKIGDKSISVNEFIRRAEYTVRPPYCNGNHSHEKKIIANSLIAEKLMAIVATDTNAFITDDRIQTYLRGIKEQTMRQWLYERDALAMVVPDTAQIRETYKVAGRKYNIAYFSLSDSVLARQVRQEINTKRKSFETAFREITGQDSLPRREVAWDPEEKEMVLDSLFSGPLTKGQVVGPIKVAGDKYLMVKATGWVNKPVISESQEQERWGSVKEEFVHREAARRYDEIIYNVMKGKKLEFNPEMFFKIVELMKPVYLPKAEETNGSLKNAFVGRPAEMDKYRDLQIRMEDLYREPLFIIDNTIWTVNDFALELIAHPLVFRNHNIKESEFAQELKLAIVDMVRDKYLTQEAYKRGYDKVDAVQRTVNMWRDNINFEYYKSQLLKKAVPDSASEMAPIWLIENYLNPVVDSLQKEYSNVFAMDVEEFNKIKLTRIDMMVLRQNVPFPRVVPSFPWVTTDNKLDYGHKMGKE